MKTFTHPLRLLTILAFVLPALSLRAQKLDVEEYILPNGMKFLFVARPGEPNIAAGWVAKVGSVNERPGITGLSHLFEHMMFKGTHAIGTNDIEKELSTIAELDRVRAGVRAEEEKLIERKRRGGIDDLKDPANRSEEHKKLLARLGELTVESKKFIVKDEFDRLYSGEGGSGMNAGTNNDYTIYFIQVPANKLELWFWLESDRLANPVFREFYTERDVVYEERRMRTDSTPTGKFQEEFNALFWQSSPYSWPVVGWPSDLEGYTREEALAYYNVNYAANNLTACIVGDFDPKQAKALAGRYFGRLKHGPRDPDPVRTVEMPQLAEKRMIAQADTNPSVQIRYHTVADGHADEAALTLMTSVLNGRTGRLFKSLVVEKKIATSAGSSQNGMRFEGFFGFNGVARPGHAPEEIEQAIYQEIEKLKSEPVGERELQKVKNGEMVQRYRNLQNNFPLMYELLNRDVSRSWKTIKTDPALIDAVKPEDIQRVAKKYFAPENRAVAIYNRKGEKPGAPAPAKTDGGAK
jgi:predicted Zn-dependent peptidase